MDIFDTPYEIEQSMITIHTLLDSIAKKGDVIGYFFDSKNSLFINGKKQFDLTDSFKVKNHYTSDNGYCKVQCWDTK